MIANTETILVVDDDSMNRFLLSTDLKEEGYAVETAEDGQQALDMLHTQTFDVVLLDLLMPKMTGFQVLEQMKAESALQHIPVLIISAEEDMESVLRCVEMGATDFLPKPFEPILLHSRVKNAVMITERVRRKEPSIRGKMLVVDDDAMNRLLLATSLEGKGYTPKMGDRPWSSSGHKHSMSSSWIYSCRK